LNGYSPWFEAGSYEAREGESNEMSKAIITRIQCERCPHVEELPGNLDGLPEMWGRVHLLVREETTTLDLCPSCVHVVAKVLEKVGATPKDAIEAEQYAKVKPNLCETCEWLGESGKCTTPPTAAGSLLAGDPTTCHVVECSCYKPRKTNLCETCRKGPEPCEVADLQGTYNGLNRLVGCSEYKKFRADKGKPRKATNISAPNLQNEPTLGADQQENDRNISDPSNAIPCVQFIAAKRENSQGDSYQVTINGKSGASWYPLRPAVLQALKAAGIATDKDTDPLPFLRRLVGATVEVGAEVAKTIQELEK
jgi:hypothetical protein